MPRLEQTADTEWVDDDGYPTDSALERLRTWPFDDPFGLFAFLRSIWWASDWGFHVEDGHDDIADRPVRRFCISTGGWSGNEDALEALEHNRIFWSLYWVSERRGGHLVFEIDRRQPDERGT